MSADFRLGIQSYCFRKFLSLDNLIDALKQAELKYVEIWARHLPYDRPRDEVQADLQKIRENGITVDSCGVCGFGIDEEKNRAILDFAKLAGIRTVSADIDPEAVDAADALAGEYGVRLAVHNHGRHHRYGTFRQLQELFDRSSPNIGVCADTAWFLDAGEDPVEAVDAFRDRLYGVHLKDFVFDDEGNHEDVIVGTGGLDLHAFFERLDGINYDGYLSIEYEGDADNPLPKVRECAEAIRRSMAEFG